MRKLTISVIIVICILAGWRLYDRYHTYIEKHEIRELEVPGKQIPTYLTLAWKYNLSWAYLAAIDEVRSNYRQTDTHIIEINTKQLSKQLQDKERTSKNLKEALLKMHPPKDVTKIMQIANAYQWEAASMDQPYCFPFLKKNRKEVSYSNSWGNPRTYGGKRKHEGIDLMAPKGTPLIAVTKGTIVQKGWDKLGGWRLSIQDRKFPHLFYYYAHLSKYQQGLYVGSTVTKGQLIGYVGDSGYGPEGTTGKFDPHLHFGIYVFGGLTSLHWEAINPFSFLKAWDYKS